MNFQLNRRPLAFACSLFLVSLYFVSLFYSDLKFLLGISIVALFVLFLFASRILFKESAFFKKSLTLLLFTLPVALSLIVSFFTFDIGYKESADALSGTHTIKATVTDTSYVGDESTEYEALITECDGKEVRVRALIVTETDEVFGIGEVICLRADITPCSSGARLTDKYDLSKGFICCALCSDPESIQTLGKDSVFPYTHIAKLRLAVSGVIDKHLDRASAAIVKAVIYGDKSALPDSLNTVFAKLGISHTLAISGLHLGIVIGLAELLTKLFRFPKKARSFTALGISLFFVLLAGLTPSVCRAFIMYALFVLSSLFRRRRDPPTVLIFAVCLICLVSPTSIFDVGLHLSFFSTLGILTFALPITDSLKVGKHLKFAKTVLTACTITVCANLFTLPYSIFYFESISLISPISNLIFIPLITLLLYLGAAMTVLSFIPPIASLIVYPTRLLCTLIFYLSDGCSYFVPFCILDLDSLFAQIFGVIALAVTVILMATCSKRRYPLIAFSTYIFGVILFEIASAFIALI